MKKRKNIWLVVFSLLLLAVTVYALFSGGDVVDTNLGTSEGVEVLDNALGMIKMSLTPVQP